MYFQKQVGFFNSGLLFNNAIICYLLKRPWFKRKVHTLYATHKLFFLTIMKHVVPKTSFFNNAIIFNFLNTKNKNRYFEIFICWVLGFSNFLNNFLIDNINLNLITVFFANFVCLYAKCIWIKSPKTLKYFNIIN